MPRLPVALAAVLLACAAAPSPIARAQAPTGAAAATPAADDQVRRSTDAPYERAVWFEHSGSFRFRPELVLNGDMGTGTGGIPQPLDALTGADPDAGTLAWASVRLRYEPTLHVGNALSVHLGVDAFDNMVLGETFAGAGQGFAAGLGTQLDTAAPSSATQNDWKDALRVRYAWGNIKLFDIFDIAVGRMPMHFGLGIARNAGDCEDCDFGTITDAMRLGLTLGGFRIEGSWEFTASGATTASRAEPFASAKDLGQDDDVATYAVTLGQFPVTPAEHAAREHVLNARRDWAIDWALFSGWTDQKYTSLAQVDDGGIDCKPDEVLADGSIVRDVECIRLYERRAFFWKPGGWLRAELRPTFDSLVRIEVEAQAVIGDIQSTQRLDESDDDVSKDILSFGGAIEVEYQKGTMTAGVDVGVATGDSGVDFVGVLDGQNIVDPDDDAFADNTNVRDNGTIGAFWFNRDYRVDLLLFRQILGAVTNTVYVKPYIAFDLLAMEDARFNARFDLLYAAAAKPSGTPGRGDHWGVELDAHLTLELETGFTAGLSLGLLKPLDALQNPTTGADPDWVFGMRGLVSWSF